MKMLNEEISRIKELMSLNEAPTSSNSLFGGSKVSIPADGGHAGQIGWQSADAWDIPSPINTPVYSLTDGTLITFSDYGSKPVHTKGKTLFGSSFTIQGSNGMPDVYYTHLQNPQVKKGDKVKCGQLLGYIMDFPGSSYDHVHIGVKPPANIRDLIDSSGNIKNANKTSSKNFSNNLFGDSSYYGNFIQKLLKYIFPTLEEQYSNFGKNVAFHSKDILIPSSGNETIKSPVYGVIKNYSYNSSCKNQVSIMHQIDNQTFYLEYCGIKNVSVSRGENVSVGTVIGTTDSDVTVYFYNESGRKQYIDDMLNKKMSSTKTSKRTSGERGPIESPMSSERNPIQTSTASERNPIQNSVSSERNPIQTSTASERNPIQ
jgi:murein DD-endopeptidase MepM/ murein hydrolase activator NlpD